MTFSLYYKINFANTNKIILRNTTVNLDATIFKASGTITPCGTKNL